MSGQSPEIPVKIDPEVSTTEITSLRNEAMQITNELFNNNNQAMRGVMALVAAGIAFRGQGDPFASLIPLLSFFVVIGCAAMNRVRRMHAIRIASYLQVFAEDKYFGWERRVALARKKQSWSYGIVSFGSLSVAALAAVLTSVLLIGTAKNDQSTYDYELALGTVVVVSLFGFGWLYREWKVLPLFGEKPSAANPEYANDQEFNKMWLNLRNDDGFLSPPK